MRTIETIVREQPELTGLEVLALHEEEKLADKKAEEKYNKDKLAIIKDINENGGYYLGRFGLDQYYIRKITNLRLESCGSIYMDVESIVMFYNDTDNTHLVTRPNEMNLKREKSEYERYDQYGLTTDKRVTVKEWDAVNDYLNNIKDFWKSIVWK